MILNDHFYIALCFFLVVLISYKKVHSILFQYLEDQISQINQRLVEAQEIKNQSVETLQEVRNKLLDFNALKEEQIIQAKLSSAQSIKQYKEKLDLKILVLKNDHELYLKSLQEKFWHKNQLKILDLASDKIAMEVEDKNLSFSNFIH